MTIYPSGEAWMLKVGIHRVLVSLSSTLTICRVGSPGDPVLPYLSGYEYISYVDLHAHNNVLFISAQLVL